MRRCCNVPSTDRGYYVTEYTGTPCRRGLPLCLLPDKPVNMKSFDKLVDAGTRKAIQQDQLIKRLISQIVPVSAHAHITFCRLEGGRLRVTVDSAAWVARLRFMNSQLIDALRARNLDCHTVSYHVAPVDRPAERRSVRSSTKTIQGASSMDSAAMMVSDNPDDSLRQALGKLAKALRSE